MLNTAGAYFIRESGGTLLKQTLRIRCKLNGRNLLHKHLSTVNDVQSLLQAIESLPLKVINRIEELKS